MRTDRLSRRFDDEALARRKNLVLERVPVSAVVGRVVALKQRTRGELLGLCPFHDERTPSFTVNDGKRFYHCFGCGAHGDVISWVMQRQGLGYREAVELLESEGGLRHLQAVAPPPAKARLVPQREDVERTRKASTMWDSARAIAAGDPVDLYLRGRALVPPADYGVGEAEVNGGWPPDLRYHPALWHREAGKGLPAMVAAIRRPDGALVAVHRTWIEPGDAADRDATGARWVKARLREAKLTFGPRRGGCIRLGPEADRMVGGEGIETSLSAMQLWRRSGLCFVASDGMETVEPPFGCADFIYAADRDRHRVGEKRAMAGAAKFGAGRMVAVKVPKLPGEKVDFNDLLQLRAARQREAA